MKPAASCPLEIQQFLALAPAVYRRLRESGRPISHHLASECSASCLWVSGKHDVHVCVTSGNIHYCGAQCKGPFQTTRAGERVCTLTAQLLSGPSFVHQEDRKAVEQSGQSHALAELLNMPSLNERQTTCQQLKLCVAKLLQQARTICQQLVSSPRRHRLDSHQTVMRATRRSQAYHRTLTRCASDPTKGFAIGVAEALSAMLADIASDRVVERCRSPKSKNDITEHFSRAVVFYWLRCATSTHFPYNNATYGFVDHFCAFLFMSSEHSQCLVPFWSCLEAVFPKQADVVTWLLDSRRGMVTDCDKSLRRFLVTTDSTLCYRISPWTTEGPGTELPFDNDKFENALARLFAGRVDAKKLDALIK